MFLYLHLYKFLTNNDISNDIIELSSIISDIENTFKYKDALSYANLSADIEYKLSNRTIFSNIANHNDIISDISNVKNDTLLIYSTKNVKSHIISQYQNLNDTNIILFHNDAIICITSCKDYMYFKTGLKDFSDKQYLSLNFDYNNIIINTIYVENSIYDLHKCTNSYLYCNSNGKKTIMLPNCNCTYLTILDDTSFADDINDYTLYFFAYTNISSVLLNNCVNRIARGLFFNSRILSFISNNALVLIHTDAFYNCRFLKTVAIETCKYIFDNAFYNCQQLTDFKCNLALKYIGKNAFDSCKSLTNVILPSSLLEIDTECFKDCHSLQTIDLSHTQITELPDNAFLNCYNLQSILLPKTLKTIKCNALKNCKNLKCINLQSNKSFIDLYSYTQENMPNDLTVIVDNSVYEKWHRKSIQFNLFKIEQYSNV